MTEKEITDLLQRYIDQKCTEDEIIFIESWYDGLTHKKSIQVDEFESIKHQTWRSLNIRSRKKWSFYRYAAMLISILGLFIPTFFILQNYKKDISYQSIKNQPVKVGYRATLFLGSKDSINLNTLRIGEAVNANGIEVKKLDNGIISYEVKSNFKNTGELNRLIVPRGGQFKIKLADSSLVVMNSESELEFPAQFLGNERRIRMVGEGYFEVTKNKYKPFVVSSKEQEVTVLGTKFNIQAYQHEKTITTTLLEGRVQVSTPQGKVILTPGNQALYNGKNLFISEANATSVSSWKEDMFLFENEPLGKIMQQLSRWYNVEVSFETKDITNICFTGGIAKYQNINQALHLLEITGKVKFTVDSHKIYVKAN